VFRDELIRTLAGVAGQESVRCAFPFGCEGYHISQHHGPRGVRIAVTAQNLQNLLQLSVRNEDGVEAHQTVNDDTAILELEGEGEAVPKADRLIRRGRFVACFDAKAPEATVEAVRAQLRAPRP